MASDEEHALWRSIGSSQSGMLGREVKVIRIDARAKVDPLVASMEDAEVGGGQSGTTIFVYDRPTVIDAVRGLASARGLRELLRYWRFGGVKSVVHAISVSGFDVIGVYAIWPFVDAPRIAYPQPDRRLCRMVHRTGALGGGGERSWRRMLVRSWIARPLFHVLVPGVAIIASIENEVGPRDAVGAHD